MNRPPRPTTTKSASPRRASKKPVASTPSSRPTTDIKKLSEQLKALRLPIFGRPGSGKTNLLCVLGNQLVRQGRSVCFTTCQLLVQELLRAKRDLRLERLLKTLRKYEALIIDDLGYVQQSREEMEVPFTLLAERYERGSVLLSSNLPFSK